MSDFFWSDSIWLPPGIKWTDLEKFQKDGGTIPLFEDLYIIFPLSIAILVLRKTLEKIVFKPIGHGFQDFIGKNILIFSFFINLVYEYK